MAITSHGVDGGAHMSQSFNEIVHDVSSTATLTEHDRHQLLESERRRLAFHILGNHSGAIDLEELATEVARREDGVDHADEDAVERIACALHHCHLPMMGETGVLTYHPEDHRVTRDQFPSP